MCYPNLPPTAGSSPQYVRMRYSQDTPQWGVTVGHFPLGRSILSGPWPWQFPQNPQIPWFPQVTATETPRNWPYEWYPPPKKKRFHTFGPPLTHTSNIVIPDVLQWHLQVPCHLQLLRKFDLMTVLGVPGADLHCPRTLVLGKFER